ncbi:MAG: hypothetical protein J7513_14355 [Solirubrobacteraceae bacterium]|nr:hypothetical protein [Solirubrobacteraceae bacterium]
MSASDLVPVLGHARVLSEGLGDARRRVVAWEGDEAAGVAVFEPLFGPHAEAVIAIRPGDSDALLPYLLDELLERVQDAGLVAVRFVFESREQRHIAERLVAVHSHCALRRDWLDIRLEPAPGRTAARAAA